MPSYRPKSLNELNSIYDKKLAAENAMKKGSSQLNDKPPMPDTKPPEYEPYKFDESKFERKTPAPVDDISGAVNEFIKNFGKQDDKKAVKVQNITPVQTTVHSTKIASKTPHKPHAKVETPKKNAASKPAPKKQERTVLVRNDERSDLMDDYKRIMMDEDEDSLSIKERLALKKKNKAEKKENKKEIKKEAKQKKESKKAEKKAAAPVETPKETKQKTESKPEMEIVIETDDISAIADSFISSHVPQPEVAAEPVQSVQTQEEIEPEESYPVEEEIRQDVSCEETYSEEYETVETQQYDEQENSEEHSDLPADEEEYYDNSEEEEDMFDSFVSHEKKKASGGAGKVISLLLLFIVLLLTATVGSLKYVAGVDTGKAVFGKYYIFTVKESFTSMNINLGDLVISENRAASATEAFVYYDTSIFRFAKPSEVASANSYVVVGENDTGSVVASSENIRGTVILTIPVAGRIVSMIMNNFLVVFLSLAGLSLVMVLITAIVFAKGRKRQQELLFSIDGDDEDEYYEDDYNYESAENEAYETEEQNQLPEENTTEETYENEEYAYAADTFSQADENVELSEQADEIPMPFYELADEDEE